MGMKLTVFFEEPFWVGVFERTGDGTLETAKVTFGSEPKDCEVYRFVLEKLNKLPFYRVFASDVQPVHKVNPKRRQRLAKEEVRRNGVGTRAQRALALEREAKKEERRATNRQHMHEEAVEQYLRRQEKRKEKHRGH